MRSSHVCEAPYAFNAAQDFAQCSFVIVDSLRNSHFLLSVAIESENFTYIAEGEKQPHCSSGRYELPYCGPAEAGSEDVYSAKTLRES
jgi:hypothetical protein